MYLCQENKDFWVFYYLNSKTGSNYKNIVHVLSNFLSLPLLLSLPLSLSLSFHPLSLSIYLSPSLPLFKSHITSTFPIHKYTQYPTNLNKKEKRKKERKTLSH